jgi:multiple sugar transport system permease protein
MITRTANPTSRSTTAVSNSPSRSVTTSLTMRWMRRSAWLAPAATAADSAASASSRRGNARKSGSTCRGALTANTVVRRRHARFNSSVANRVRATAAGYALLAPSLFGVVTFLLLPMLVVGWLSVHRWDLLGPVQYVGLDNWRSVLTDPSFATSLVVTALFIVIVVPTQSLLGLAAAAMLARSLPGSGFFRTLYVLPWICSPLAIAVLWRWILAPTDGAVNTLLGERIEWLTDPDLALPVVSAVTIWTNVGYVTLFFLAGMLAIPTDIQDAARTDGANAWQRFRRITLPMLRPTLFFVLVTGVISTAQVFDTVYALTAGGPQGRTDLIAHRIYTEAFGAAAVGRAAVMAAVLFVLLVGVTIAQHSYFRRRITYDIV